MPGLGYTGRPRNLGRHRSERIESTWPERNQEELVGEGYRPLYLGPESAANGVLIGPAGVDPDVPILYRPRINIDEPLTIIWTPGDGQDAVTDIGSYVTLEGEKKESRFYRQVQIPMQLANMDKQYGWRQDTELDDIAWPYRLIAGIDYSGPAHPQHSNVWPLPADFGTGQGNYDQFTTQTPLFPVDVATAFPLDHPIAGDMWGIIGPNEHA